MIKDKIQPEDCMRMRYARMVGDVSDKRNCYDCEVDSKEDCIDYVPMSKFMEKGEEK